MNPTHWTSIIFETKKVPAKAFVERPGVDVCTPSCTVKLVTSSQDNGSTVQQLFEETEEFRMLRVSSWMVTQQVAIYSGFNLSQQQQSTFELVTAGFDYFSPRSVHIETRLSPKLMLANFEMA